MDGIELLAKVKQIRPETMVILMTAYGTVKTAVRAMKLGAEDYLPKPIDVEELEVDAAARLEKKRLLKETRHLRERLEQKYRFENLVGESPEMLAVFKTVRQVAPSNASVLLARRERHRQGADRPGDPPEQPAPGQALRAGQLRGAARDAAGERAVRAREGRLHRRDPTRGRPLRAGGRRDALPRRDRRHARRTCRSSCCASCRSASSSASAARDAQGRRARRRRHQPRPARRARATGASARTCSTG